MAANPRIMDHRLRRASNFKVRIDDFGTSATISNVPDFGRRRGAKPNENHPCTSTINSDKGRSCTIRLAWLRVATAHETLARFASTAPGNTSILSPDR